MSGLLNDDEDRYGSISWDIERLPLDYRKLLEGGAIRITQPGTVMGSPAGDSDPNGYSIVTAYNDKYPDSYTRGWGDKPESYDNAIRELESLPLKGSDGLYDGKYRQILWSAQQKGLTDYFKRPQGLLGGR